MDILVFGAGAIGSTYGGFLSKAHEITLLGRRSHLEAIRKKGLKVSGIWGRHVFRRFHLETDARFLARKKKRFDLVLVTVKSYDTARAAQEISRILAPETLVVSLQNGLGNIESLHRVLPPAQVLAGRVIFGVILPTPGEICVTVIANPTAIGETAVTRVTGRVRKLAAMFSEAGIPTVVCPDIFEKIWAKVIYNCALNPLASILDCHYGLLGEYESTRRIMDEVMEEIYAVGKKLKVRLRPSRVEAYRKLFFSALLPRTYDHRPSMLQDLEKGRRTEIEALNGAVVRLGERCGVRTPVNRWLADLIREREKA